MGTLPGVIGYPVGLLIPDLGRCYTDGNLPVRPIAPEIAWYLNPGVNTTVGPTFLDGDANTAGPGIWPAAGLPGTVPPLDLLGFNAPWSLPDFERGTFSYQQWAYYINSTVNDPPFNADITTDVTMTFPTKHYHYMFARPLSTNPANPPQLWPFWNGGGNNYLLCGLYEDAVAAERALIKGRWDAIFNARCFLNGWVWDSEQNFDRLSPGPSPFGPSVPFVRHEVNVIRVGAPNDILATAFTQGQFILTDWVFDTDQRATWPNAWGGQARPAAFCEIPLYGETIRKHNAPDSPFVYRSSMMHRRWLTYYDFPGVNIFLSACFRHGPQRIPPFPIPDHRAEEGSTGIVNETLTSGSGEP